MPLAGDTNVESPDLRGSVEPQPTLFGVMLAGGSSFDNAAVDLGTSVR